MLTWSALECGGDHFVLSKLQLPCTLSVPCNAFLHPSMSYGAGSIGKALKEYISLFYQIFCDGSLMIFCCFSFVKFLLLIIIAIIYWLSIIIYSHKWSKSIFDTLSWLKVCDRVCSRIFGLPIIRIRPRLIWIHFEVAIFDCLTVVGSKYHLSVRSVRPGENDLSVGEYVSLDFSSSQTNVLLTEVRSRPHKHDICTREMNE